MHEPTASDPPISHPAILSLRIFRPPIQGGHGMFPIIAVAKA